MVTHAGTTVNPSRDEFVRALRNVIEAYDRQCMLTASVLRLDEAHVNEARKLLNAVLPKSPR
jgi:hypothetical protein